MRLRFAFLTFLLLIASVLRAEAPKQTPPRTLTNAEGIKLVLVPAGEFMMGSTETIADLLKTFPNYKVEVKTDYLFQDEHPRHRVRITKPFYLGQCEVSVGEFRKFTTETGYKTDAEREVIEAKAKGPEEFKKAQERGKGIGGWGYNSVTHKCDGRDPKYNWLNTGFRQSDDHPVIDVTWDDAMAFCKWLSRKEGKTYRLPTEAEWEYACRAGATTRYSNGDDPTAVEKIANAVDWRNRTEFGHVQEIDMRPDGTFTLPVGGRPANAFGLRDMHGNVWEWCSDWYAKDYYGKSPVDDPQGPPTGNRRVRRGGAWNSFPLYLRASFRNWNSPASRCVNLGFRVALTAE